MQYETPEGHQQKDLPDAAERKLGSAQPDRDPFDAVAGTGPAGIPREGVVVAERLPTTVIPVEALPAEKQATGFMTPETRPRDVRPREFRPV
jgi:hypothetical protein